MLQRSREAVFVLYCRELRPSFCVCNWELNVKEYYLRKQELREFTELLFIIKNRSNNLADLNIINPPCWNNILSLDCFLLYGSLYSS